LRLISSLLQSVRGSLSGRRDHLRDGVAVLAEFALVFNHPPRREHGLREPPAADACAVEAEFFGELSDAAFGRADGVGSAQELGELVAQKGADLVGGRGVVVRE
jgi:hypothetical protein